MLECSRCSSEVAERRLAMDFTTTAAHKRRLSGQNLTKNRSQCEHIGPLVDRARFAPRLLGRHVCRRAQHRAGHRPIGIRHDPRGRDDRALHIGFARRGIVDHAAFGQDFGETPVHDLHFAEVADHHVGGLQIAVDHVPRMGVGHRLADLLENGQKPCEVVGRRVPVAKQVGECLSLHQLHGEVGAPIAKASQLVNRHDARVLQLATDLSLLHEPAHEVGIFLVRFKQDLDGQVAPEVGIASLQYGAHAAPGDFPEKHHARGPVGCCRHFERGRVHERRLGHSSLRVR